MHPRNQGTWTGLLAAAVGLCFATSSWAAGTAVGVQSARTTGMASSVTAMIDDASAIYSNPAGIAQGKRVDVLFGDTLIIPKLKFTSATTGNTASTSGVVPPLHLYATVGLTKDLSVGVGVFSPFGMAVKWPSDWEGRSLVTNSTLATYYVNPTVAYRIGRVRMGAGLQLVRATLDLQRKIRFGDQEGSSELGGDSWGVGANVGAQIEAIPQYLSFGVHYRSAVKLDFAGSAHFDNVPPPLAATLHDQRVSSSLTQPDSLAFGVASHPIPWLVVDIDLVWYGWKTTHAVAINFPDDQSGTLSSSMRKDWKNTVSLSVGGEAKVAAAWRVRAGVMYDPSPSPADTLTPETPDADRLNLALGVGYRHASGFHVDLGYQLIVLLKKSSTAPQLPGEYGGWVHILGITVGFATLPTAGPVEPTATPLADSDSSARR
jgi:long-chain fatty acid transport protein